MSLPDKLIMPCVTHGTHATHVFKFSSIHSVSFAGSGISDSLGG